EKEIADYFEAVLEHYRDPKQVNNWVRNEVLRIASETGNGLSGSPVSPAALAELLLILDKKEITPQTAKTVLDDMAASGKSAALIIEEKGLKQISDSGELEALIDTILAENVAEVARYRSGETKLLAFFIGLVMRATKGQADQSLSRDILTAKLES
ncbi:MAG: Asp-tRNA(Asn)/Glu-tRNA(Gln) amidotransferase GatCAB subunit B, partial [Candidatus Marinimicrobia bacterium]|nr:Asp-tRNA(Asn)/Glu-tRNA(Gln) amidotransferase GatCAB subunit B [Candidatus Neomarinimicrobiota bacterium]